MTTELVPKELLEAVITRFNPQRVLLFGSRATGRASADSDIDLLVIVDDDTPAGRLSLKAGFAAGLEYPGATDIIPCRSVTFRQRSRIVGTLCHTALKVSSFMSDEGAAADLGRRRSAGLRSQSVTCLAARPPLMESSAFSCQQAGEKLLKGLLVAAAKSFPKTHDLKHLGNRVMASHPHLRVPIERIRSMSIWGFAYRYPFEETAIAPPAPAEIEAALAYLGGIL